MLETMVPNNVFVLIEAEKLSMDDDFMKYKPRTQREVHTKALITSAIKHGVKNFYRAKYDPSFTDDGEGFCFEMGKAPAVGKSYIWWIKAIRDYGLKNGMKMGTKLQYGAFLGVLMKRLMEEGKSVEWVWNAVCNDSRELGHYCNSENAQNSFEPTGSRLVTIFYDLANTYKILTDDINWNEFWLASAIYSCDSKVYPISDICRGSSGNFGLHGVAWIVKGSL